MKPAQPIASLGDIADHYDAILCDVWGVIHDGHAAFADTCAALQRFREQRGPVLLLSNAPRPGDGVIALLDQLGVPATCYDGILTSGDATRLEMQRQGDAAFFHLGPDRDREVWAGLPVREAKADDASIILCTGLFDDERETPDTYRDQLKAWQARGVPMICANPDLKVSRGPRLIWCAGAVAAAYEEMGGEVTYFGKPHPPVYDQALDQLDRIAGRHIDTPRILAIGDGLMTDILGANRAGLDSLLVTAGIHAALFGPANAPETSRVHTALETEEVFATAFLPRLIWPD